MLHLPAYIPALLHRYDCVVIPDLGGFVANYSPARLDKSKGVVYPPSKGIIFNKNLVRNDGLLVNEIASMEQVSYQQALEMVNVFVQHSKAVLAGGGRMELEGLGYLYYDNERNIQFLQHQTVNFLNDSFGLAPVMAVPLTVNKTEKVAELKPVTGEKPAVQDIHEEIKENTVPLKEATVVAMKEVTEKAKRVKQRSTRRIFYRAAAVLLPVLFYSYWLPFQTPMLRTGEFSWDYLNPFGTYAVQSYQERKVVMVESQPAIIGEMPAGSADLPEMTTEQTVAETTYVPKPLVTDEKRFHIIAGCFVNYDNALTQISELKAAGSPAYLFGQSGGFYRVAIGSFASENEAVTQLQAVRQGGQPHAWLLEE